MVDVTDITGIGPAKAETLEEHGYESVEDIANADTDELGAIDGVGGNRALEFAVEAENLLEESQDDSDESDDEDGDSFDLTPNEVSDGLDEELEEEVEELEEELEEEVEEMDESNEQPSYAVDIEFDNPKQYDVFHAALMRHHENIYTSDQPAADTMEKLLSGLDSFDSVSYSLDEQELNELHSAVLQQRTNYQGDNLIDHMDEMKEIEQQVNDMRSEYLF